jgi:hypothetical protein
VTAARCHLVAVGFDPLGSALLFHYLFLRLSPSYIPPGHLTYFRFVTFCARLAVIFRGSSVACLSIAACMLH